MTSTHKHEEDGKITMFYDETCIICRTEAKVMREQYADKVRTVTVTDGLAELEKVGISQVDAMTYLCVQDAQGIMHKGMDASRLLYTTVGKWYAKWLYFPVIKQLADFGYPIFARNRYYFPAWFTKLVFGTVAEEDDGCSDGVCRIPPSKRKLDHK